MDFPEFIKEFNEHIAPLYPADDIIHGYNHIGRCLIYGELMADHANAYYNIATNKQTVRYAIAFHDAGRNGRTGADQWERQSRQLAANYLEGKESPFVISTISDCIENKKSNTRYAYIVHDADCLDIMRPSCGHGGISNFDETRLLFLQNNYGINPSSLRKKLIQNCWELISKTDHAQPINIYQQFTELRARVFAD